MTQHSLTSSPSYLYYAGGAVSYTGGTSAAAPVIAGIVGLLNDARLRRGQPTMGFLNPWLYGSGSGSLIDVTAGKARGCTGVNLQTGKPIEGSVIPWASWNGTAGWDPATGMGMPDLVAMLDSALKVAESM